MQATVTRERRTVKPNTRKPAPRKPRVRSMDGTSITCPEPVCTVDYSAGSLAWTVETMLEQDERAHEAAMCAEHDADLEARHFEAINRDQEAWERSQFGFGLFPLDMAV